MPGHPVLRTLPGISFWKTQVLASVPGAHAPVLNAGPADALPSRLQIPVTWQLADVITRSLSHGGGHEVGPAELRTSRGWSRSPGDLPFAALPEGHPHPISASMPTPPTADGPPGPGVCGHARLACSSRQRCRDTRRGRERRAGRREAQRGPAARPGCLPPGGCGLGPLPQECLVGPQPRPVGGDVGTPLSLRHLSLPDSFPKSCRPDQC